MCAVNIEMFPIDFINSFTLATIASCCSSLKPFSGVSNGSGKISLALKRLDTLKVFRPLFVLCINAFCSLVSFDNNIVCWSFNEFSI